MTNEELIEELEQTTELKRRLAVRIAMDILESEAFMEGYPGGLSREEMIEVLTRVLWKNKVSTEDGRAIFAELAEEYELKYAQLDREV